MTESSAPPRLGPLRIALLCFVAVVFTSLANNDPWGPNHNKDCGFAAMLDGTADTPFVTRVLLPWTLRGIGAMVGEGPREQLDELLTPRHPLTRLLNNLAKGWERELAVEYLAYILISILAMLGFAMAVRSLMHALYRPPRWLNGAVPLIAMALVPTFSRPYGMYIYDIPLLCLYTWGLTLMARQRWVPYLVVFFLACLNKETTLLLIVVFATYHWPALKARRKRAVQLLLIQGAIYLATRLSIAAAYADDATRLVQYHFIRNLFLYPPYSLTSVMMIVALVGAVMRRWREKPAFLRAALSPAIPLTILGFTFGFFDELRDYLELLPPILLLVFPTACEFAEVPLVTRPERPPL